MSCFQSLNNVPLDRYDDFVIEILCTRLRLEVYLCMGAFSYKLWLYFISETIASSASVLRSISSDHDGLEVETSQREGVIGTCAVH